MLGLRLGLICGGIQDMAADGSADIVAGAGMGCRCVKRGVDLLA